jgi:hypothetical protein
MLVALNKDIAFTKSEIIKFMKFMYDEVIKNKEFA